MKESKLVAYIYTLHCFLLAMLSLSIKIVAYTFLYNANEQFVQTQ